MRFHYALLMVLLCFFLACRSGRKYEANMRLLQLSELRQMMVNPMTKVVPSDYEIQTARLAAPRALPIVGLPGIVQADLKLEITYRSGNGRNLLFHYNYGAPDVYLIIVLENGGYFGHILFDIGADYRPAMASIPHLAQVQEATEKLIEQVVAKLPHQTDPYVILTTGEGTYMLALWTKEGFVLEHQLVTLSCQTHVTQEQVIAALKSYAFGKYEWTTGFSWRLMKL